MNVVRSGQGGPIQIGTVNLDAQNKTNLEKIDIQPVSSGAEVSGDKKDYNENDVKKAVDKLNKFLDDSGTYAEYQIHEKLKDVMITIRDSKTKEVIREIPPKKILDMVAKMMEMVGILVDKRA